MLSAVEIEDLIHMNVPEATAREQLLYLKPENVDLQTFQKFVQVISASGLTLPLISDDIMDCCGTGGSGIPHYNTSTTVTFVLAAGGVKVAKFGNRAITSQSGSFDFLEALGIPTQVPPETSLDLLEKNNIAFLYAPQYYPALKRFNQLRKSIGVKTIFNFMGPLLNPVRPSHRLLGVSSPEMQKLLSDYLVRQTETKHALVVCGENHLDEMSPHGTTTLYHIASGAYEQTAFQADFPGYSQLESTELDGYKNLEIFQKLIDGEDQSSIYHRMVCLNAGAGFYIAGKAPTIEDGAHLAENLLTHQKVSETVLQCRRDYANTTR